MYKPEEDEVRYVKVVKKNGKGAHRTKCDVRLTMDEDVMLSKLASDNGVTRSDVMRRALKSYYNWLTDKKSD